MYKSHFLFLLNLMYVYYSHRRFTKRVYVMLPSKETRVKLLEKLLAKQENSLSKADIRQLSKYVIFVYFKYFYNLSTPYSVFT